MTPLHGAGRGNKKSAERGTFYTVTPRLHNKLSVVPGTLSLSDAEELTGITNQQVSKWAKRLKSEPEYRAALYGAAYRKAMGEATARNEFCGEVEWYTPSEYIEAARDFMGGIDLDPASSEQAQLVVKATSHFTPENDGLKQKWVGRVWLNPPYVQPLIQQFVAKLVAETATSHLSEAILLTHLCGGAVSVFIPYRLTVA